MERKRVERTAAMSEKKGEEEMQRLSKQVKANTKKIDEIESRIDKVIQLCKEADIKVVSVEFAESISECVKATREVALIPGGNEQKQ